MVLAIVLVVLVSVAWTADAEQSTPTLELSQSDTSVGEAILVRGTGWNPNGVLQVETCGNLALNGSTDCAVASGVSVRVAADGSWSAGMAVATPPVPCPCVVSVRSSDGGASAKVDVAIAGTVRATPSRSTSLDDRSGRTAAEVGSTQAFAGGMEASVVPWGLVGLVALAMVVVLLMRRRRRARTANRRLESDQSVPPTRSGAGTTDIELHSVELQAGDEADSVRVDVAEHPAPFAIGHLPPPVLAAELPGRD